MQTLNLSPRRPFDNTTPDWLAPITSTSTRNVNGELTKIFAVSFTPTTTPLIAFGGTGAFLPNGLPTAGSVFNNFGYAVPEGIVFEFDDLSLTGLDLRPLFRVFDGFSTPAAKQAAFQAFLDAQFRINFDGTQRDDGFGATRNSDTIFGNGGDDTLLGYGSRDTIDGGAGNDSLDGGPGADAIAGGSGNDVIAGSGGNDTIIGEGGNDTLAGNGGNDRIDGGGGNDEISGRNGNDSLTGGAGRDTLDGNKGNDTLSGDQGGDVINGGDGRDTVIDTRGPNEVNGQGGADTLETGNSKDTIDGGQGNDEIKSGANRDILTGGGGEDTFIFNASDDRNIITDFEIGVDKIEIESGADRFRDLEITSKGGDAFISFADTEIRLNGVDPDSLSASDFIFT